MAPSSGGSAQPTVDEIIALLKKTALPTVICEGSDDLIVYRRLEERLSHLGVSVLPAGGRKNVLQLFDRRAEIPAVVRLAFLADKDTWIYTGVPPAYTSAPMCLTDGYSIENDVIQDGNLETLFTGSEIVKFQTELGAFLDWYALALSRHLTDPTKPIAQHPDLVLDPTQRPALLALEPGEVYPTFTRTTLNTEYKKSVRGKSLLSLIVRNANRRPTKLRHSCRGLMETVAARPGPLLDRIAKSVETTVS